MTKLKTSTLKSSLSVHKSIMWIAGFSLLIYIVSAFAHPLMIWTGPRAASFFPPQAQFDPAYAKAIPEILSLNQIQEAAIIKIVPSDGKAILQVSQTVQGPKKYYDLTSFREVPDQDMQQAIWLARYYSGLKDTPIKSIDIQDKFDQQYPWVNRLLPVYKVRFDTADNKTVFVHTETSAMASMSNDWKATLQFIFQTFHTGSWLDSLEVVRVMTIGTMILLLLGIGISGALLLFLMRSRKIKQKSRRLHRVIAYLVIVPFLSLGGSGLFHLIQSSLTGDSAEEKPERSLALSLGKFEGSDQVLAYYSGLSFNAISLVQGPDGTLFYRLGIPGHLQSEFMTRSQQFDGVATERHALYLQTAKPSNIRMSDREMTIAYARSLLNKSGDISATATLITRFGPDYDFRNKRLPVWKVVFEDRPDDNLFMDPVSGILVDRVNGLVMTERYIFSWFHKWDFLVPITGRPGRDLIVVSVLSLLFILTLFGIYMRLRPPSNTRRKRKQT